MAATRLTVNVGDMGDVTQDGLTVETASPTGDSLATWQATHIMPLNRRQTFGRGVPVEIADEYGGFWHGRIEVIKRKFDKGGVVYAYTAQGWGASGRDQPVNTAGASYGNATIEQIFIKTLAACPQISHDPGAIKKTGVVIANFVITDTQTPRDVWDILAQQGDADYGPLYWHVRGGEDGTPYLEVTGRPATPTYYTSLADGAVIEVEDDLGVVYNSVVTHSSGITQTADDYASQHNPPPVGLGFLRRLSLDVGYGGVGADLDRMAHAVLKAVDHDAPMRGQIMLASDTRVTSEPGGAAVPLQRVRSGNLIQVLDMQPFVDAGTVDSDTFYITGTRYDAKLGDNTLSLEGFEDFHHLIARYTRQQRLT